MNEGDPCLDPVRCEADSAIVDLIAVYRATRLGQQSEMPLRRLCAKCQQMLDSLIKRRLAAKIDLT